MINVVFLLLIFFLMTAQIAPPDPFEVTPPYAVNDAEGKGANILYLGRDGDIAFETARGEAAIPAAVARAEELDEPLFIRADRQASGIDLARLLAAISVAGGRDVRLVTVGD